MGASAWRTVNPATFASSIAAERRRERPTPEAPVITTDAPLPRAARSVRRKMGASCSRRPASAGLTTYARATSGGSPESRDAMVVNRSKTSAADPGRPAGFRLRSSRIRRSSDSGTACAKRDAQTIGYRQRSGSSLIDRAA